jgi:hypothetical protein
MITGSCVCGAVAFEVTEPFESAGWCHCTRCQKRTGTSASAAGAAAAGTFAIVRGQESVREWAPPEGWVKAFCTDCGGHLYSRAPEGFERVAVRLGAVDGDPGIRPQYHQFTASAAVWDPLPEDGLPRHPGRRPPGA